MTGVILLVVWIVFELILAKVFLGKERWRHD